MKSRFTTVDLFAIVHDIQDFLDLRVQNIYDIDSKTYLIKLHRSEKKAWLLLESGSRVQPTEFEWRKSQSPSSFSMKLRKHIKQKRIKAATQLGIDRILDLQFGEDEVACHVIVELYDRGNVVLTDSEYTILNILRPRTDKDSDVRFAVREKYPVARARQSALLPREELLQLLSEAKQGENLRKVLGPRTQYGPALLEHGLRSVGLSNNSQLGKQVGEDAFPKVYEALMEAERVFLELREKPGRGILVTKSEVKPASALPKEEGSEAPEEKLETFVEFHPFLYGQFTDGSKGPDIGYQELPCFYQAVDTFFSSRESQAIDRKALQQEKEALKKLDNIKRDHERRLGDLQDAQRSDAVKAERISGNSGLVDRAILIICSAIANQLSWAAIQEMVEEGRRNGDPVAQAIAQVNLDKNQITLSLPDPFRQLEGSEEESDEEVGPINVEIDLNFGAHQNARRFYDHRKQAGLKEQKTIFASKKALKSAEAKTIETLQQVQVKTVVQKQRKIYWFEKFLWFVSTDGYLVIGGRDATQNELLVKKYLKAGDVYAHADLRGAASVVVKNRIGAAESEIPPKTLHEAGTMAVCYSAAWDAKVVSGAWWVGAAQVTKTAPTGEYLTAGSFMIRGKKNFLPPANLHMGFGFLFRLDDDSIEERKKAGIPSILGGKAAAASQSDSTQNDAAEEEEVELLADGDASEEEPDKVSEEVEFPDVAVKLQHLSVSTEETTVGAAEEFTLLHLGPKRPEPNWRQKREAAQREAAEAAADAQLPKEEVASAPSQPKRGQKARRAKVAAKYADQDEEERELRMEILASAGGGGKKLKGKAKRKAAQAPLKRAPRESRPKEDPEPSTQDDVPEESAGDAKEVEAKAEAEEAEEEEEKGEDEVSEALGGLTARPRPDDLVLFALPVCAPYATMANYKYKVKLTPGPGKKGKACKTALMMFTKDRDASQREKDLLKATQESDLGRNLPGKVKVSAPQLLAAVQKSKK